MPLFAIAFPYFFLAILIASIISFFISRKLALIMLLCLLPGFSNLYHTVAFNCPRKFNDKKGDSTLRIITWNVEYFVNLSQKSEISNKMLQVIAQKKPDIVCLQEFMNVEHGRRRISIRKKMDSLGYPNYFFSNDEVFTNRLNAVITQGCAIFSKFPFTDSGHINIRKKRINENLMYVDINFNKKPLRIYTAHLASFGFYRDTQNLQKDVYEITYERKRGIQYKLREVEQLHEKEVKIINEELSKTNKPIVYCGDLNTVPSSYTYHLLKNDFQDAFLEKGIGLGATFYKIFPGLRIDYCFADKRFKITNCAVIKEKLADHYPLITDMQWK